MYEEHHGSSSSDTQARYYINRPGQSVLGVPSWNSYV